MKNGRTKNEKWEEGKEQGLSCFFPFSFLPFNSLCYETNMSEFKVNLTAVNPKEEDRRTPPVEMKNVFCLRVGLLPVINLYSTNEQIKSIVSSSKSSVIYSLYDTFLSLCMKP